MTDFKQCDFFLLRYVPDVVKGGLVNIGVALLEDSDGGFTGVRFVRDWRRARGLDPEVDTELLEAYEEDLRRVLDSRLPEVINYRGPMSRRDWLLAQMQQSFSGALDVTPMTAVLTESPQAELGKLAQTFLEPATGAIAYRPVGARSITPCATHSSRPVSGRSCRRILRWQNTPGKAIR